jgi:hypothetical protein
MITIPMPIAERQLVIDVRTGKYSLAEVSKLIIEAELAIAAAYEKSPLPLWPDRAYVQDWMIARYMNFWSGRGD